MKTACHGHNFRTCPLFLAQQSQWMFPHRIRSQSNPWRCIHFWSPKHQHHSWNIVLDSVLTCDKYCARQDLFPIIDYHGLEWEGKGLAKRVNHNHLKEGRVPTEMFSSHFCNSVSIESCVFAPVLEVWWPVMELFLGAGGDLQLPSAFYARWAEDQFTMIGPFKFVQVAMFRWTNFIILHAVHCIG